MPAMAAESRLPGNRHVTSLLFEPIALTSQMKSAVISDSILDESARRPQFVAGRLATAHLAVSLFAFAAAVAAIGRWPAVRAGGHVLEVDAAAQCAAWASLAYLLVTSLTEARAGLPPRGAARPPVRHRWLRLAAHALVLIAAVVSLARDLNSLALLAGLDVILPAIATVSLLTLMVGYCQQRVQRWTGEGAAGEFANLPESWLWLSCQWAAAIFFVITLVNLELQPKPHGKSTAMGRRSTAAAALFGSCLPPAAATGGEPCI
jgi:hypothetical protein